MVQGTHTHTRTHTVYTLERPLEAARRAATRAELVQVWNVPGYAKHSIGNKFGDFSGIYSVQHLVAQVQAKRNCSCPDMSPQGQTCHSFLDPTRCTSVFSFDWFFHFLYLFFFLLVIFSCLLFSFWFSSEFFLRFFFRPTHKSLLWFAGRALFTKCICGMSSCSARARATPCAAIKSCDLLRHAGSAHFSSLSRPISFYARLSLFSSNSLFLSLSFFRSLSVFALPRSSFLIRASLVDPSGIPVSARFRVEPREMPDGISCCGKCLQGKTAVSRAE